MLILSTKPCKELEASALVCPVYNDFIFQLPYIRSYLDILQPSVTTQELSRLLSGQLKQIGDFYLFECVEQPKPYRWIYFVLIRTFFDKPAFSILCEGITNVLLDAMAKQFSSICLPPFDSNYLSFSTEMRIMAQACLKSFEQNTALGQMNITIPHVQNPNKVREIFSVLPSKLFQHAQDVHKKQRTNMHIRSQLNES